MESSIEKVKLAKKAMRELGINIEIKSLYSLSSNHKIYEFNSIFFEGKKSSETVTQDHYVYLDSSEIIGSVCEFFKCLSEYREAEGVKSKTL